MTRPVPLGGAGDVAASHHAVLTRKQAAEVGLTARVLQGLVRREVVQRVAPGVISFRGTPATWRQRLDVATVTAGCAGIASTRSAALLHRLDGFTEELVEVTVARGKRVRIPGVIVQQVSVPIPPEDIVEIDGIRCTSLARTLVDVAAVVDVRMLERALDDFERRSCSLTPARARREPTASAGPARHEADPRGGASPPAARCRARVVVREADRGVHRVDTAPPVVAQHSIHDSAGSFICAVDLAIPDVKPAIECHSRAFHTGDHTELVDQRRENRAMLEGWQFLYLGWADRKTPRQARQFLEQLVRRRCADLGVKPLCAK